MDARVKAGGAVVVLVILGFALWATVPPVDRVVVPLPAEVPPVVVAPAVEAATPSGEVHETAAMQVLADIEGAYVVRCPQPPEPLGRGPFLRQMGALMLVGEPDGQGLAYAAPPRPGHPRPVADVDALRHPRVLVRWGDAATGVGWCVFEAVEEVLVAGVVADEESVVVPSWVTGCGVAMQAVDEQGRFEISVPVGEPCLLQAEGRGEGLWVNPAADTEEVLVPWAPRLDGEREEVAARLARSLEALEALDAMVDPLQLALERELDPDTRAVLEVMLAQTQQEQAGRRAWVERALERYSVPPQDAPEGLEDDDEDRWPGLE